MAKKPARSVEEEFVESVARDAWKPIDNRTPWEWAEDNVVIDKTSPFPGRFRASTAPWTKEFMEVFANNGVSDISVMCSAQSSKTQTLMILLCWAVSEDPGPMMWVMAATDEAKTFCKTRLWPTLEDCPRVAQLISGNKKTMLEIDFASMPLVVNGANSKSKLQSKPIRWLFLDEVRNYPKGALEMVLKRTRAFWNARRVIISTPDQENDAVHLAFLSGDQRRYMVKCQNPDCDERFEMSWDFLKWDDNDQTHHEGRWDIDILSPTIRMECPVCSHPHLDLPQIRKRLADSGTWKPHNSLAPANRVSFTWSALLPPWVRWRDLVEEFLESKRAVNWRDFEKLKSFVNESLGQPWEDRMKDVTDWRWLEKNRKAFLIRDEWADEKRRFLTVDVQKDHLKWLCRAWGTNGASRLIDCGQVVNWDDIRQLASDLRVNNDDVVVDSGYNATEVYRQVVASGYAWKALKGDTVQHYMRNGFRRNWNIGKADPALGTPQQGKLRPIKLYFWAGHLTKDYLLQHMRGMGGGEWELPFDTPDWYLNEVTAEIREESTDAKGRSSWGWVQVRRDNHMLDCECMQIVAALITGMTMIGSDGGELPDVDRTL